MTAPDARVKQLKELANAEKCDDAWISQASQALRLPTNLLHKNDWNITHWYPHWGKVSDGETEEGQKYVLWERPDGGELAALIDEKKNVSLIRCALLGELAGALTSMNKLPYVKVGFPESWNKAVVTVDGAKVESVTSADALLGKVVTILTDDAGKPVVVKDELATNVIYGNVEISVQDKPETFF